MYQDFIFKIITYLRCFNGGKILQKEESAFGKLNGNRIATVLFYVSYKLKFRFLTVVSTNLYHKLTNYLVPFTSFAV